ncbi:hypothetical protein [Pararhodonellum marinum]|uniref:hypothetical protein n=1 Tax=Pararhodonellum marinum TaxID=2755358 RepID=UPI00188FE5AE|nr:hypothetical protein [Pararhodonellum marinum]
MKSTSLFIFSLVAALFLGPIFPFWGLMLVLTVLAAIIGGRAWLAFFAAGSAVGLVWLLVPLWISVRSGSDLPEKMGSIIGIENSIYLMLLTALIGVLIGGFSALTGNLFRKLFQTKPVGYYKV